MLVVMAALVCERSRISFVHMCMCVSDQICDAREAVCVYKCHTHMCVYLHESICVHVEEMYIFLVCVSMNVWFVEIFLITTVMLKPLGTLKRLPHVSLSIF